MSTNNKNTYVLQDREASELSRLEFQHKVWFEETIDFCSRAGVGLGQTVLDLGCGPGYLSVDLSELVGPEGRIMAVDSSKKFLDFLDARNAAEDRENITTTLGDIREVELARHSLDGAVARWVLMFLPDIPAVIQRVAEALKPQGVFAVMEYFHFRSMSVWPQTESFAKIYHAVYDLIKRNGGNADIGAAMPPLLWAQGFTIVESYPIFRIGRPGFPLWKWLEMTSQNHTNLVDSGLITREELRAYYDDWFRLSEDPHAFFTVPPVFVTIGRKH